MNHADDAWMTAHRDRDVEEGRFWRPAGMLFSALAGCAIAAVVILLGAVVATLMVGMIVAAAMIGSVVLAIGMLMPHRIRHRVRRRITGP